MYYLDPEDYGEPEVTEICIGTSWTYLGGLFRKSKVDEDAPPAADLLPSRFHSSSRMLVSHSR